MTTSLDHFRAGRLAEAIDAATATLRGDPADTSARSLLAELLCLRGEFERADRQLATLADFSPDRHEEIAAWRGLLHAARARADVFEHGATPELTGPATQRIRGLLEALLAWREDEADSAERYHGLEMERVPWRAIVDGTPVTDVRELDDRMAGILDVMTTQGQYLWVDVADVASLNLVPRRRPLEAAWRPAQLTLRDGFSGRVYIPIIYPTATDDEACLLGRRTDWQDRDGVVIGLGQRCWLAGDSVVPLGEIDAVEGPTDIGEPAAAGTETSS
ncbi:type VI secretion system accessory protein TagJ [Aquisalimonas lutea]|uniref:type VI secretion system accessory protein TagJ n=1 Tax=Aquisalimonas lutea TaxID=1327750 RepID=UPI0025B28D2A|nr:type VI secretion system accessory protein TagJ [Aquisalimonas lutea]MDN3519578.1 type VI secretion system accessory protein TagJ [Aquisalimonas lutea]